MLKFLKSLTLYLLSGWRSVDLFGYPPIRDKNNVKSYLVTAGDGTILDNCQYLGKREGRHTWQQGGMPNDMYTREVKLWKRMDKLKRWSYWYCSQTVG